MPCILSYDLGTGGTKASLFDAAWGSLASAFVSCDTRYPQELFHEQRPEDWWDTVVRSTRELLAKANLDPREIVCLAVSGHSLGVVPVDADGALLAEYVPIWSDGRAGAQAERFFQSVDETEWYLRTGNGFPPPLYGIFKILWMREHAPEVYGRAACFLGSKDYINLRMTGVMATDHSYASGSGVYDLRTRSYIPEYITAAGIDARKLPEILESAASLGTLTAEAAAALGLPQGILVAAGGVDNACMSLGAACTRDGDAYTSLGSSAWIAVSSHDPIVNAQKRPYVFAHCIPGMYVSATSIFSAGNSFRWLKNTLFAHLEPVAAAAGRDVYDLLTEKAAQAPAGSHKLFFNPTLAGGSGLDRSSHAKGCFTGLTLGHTDDDMIRATLEGICLNLRLALDVLEGYTTLSDDMLIVGGGGKSRFWRALFADIYRKNILETNVGQDAGALGAAAVAAVSAGIWGDYDEVKHMHRLRERIAPNPEANAIYEKILPVFQAICDLQSTVGEWIHDLRW